MSKTIISIERVDEVRPHPNADRLEVVQILGYQVVTGKGDFKVGDPVFYFPPDILLPEEWAEKLGVANYLKHAIFPGDEEKSKCRVGAARLRGVPSHGFCAGADVSPVPLESLLWGNGAAFVFYGDDVTDWFEGHKYEPPVRLGAGDSLPELETFHKYTEIENIGRYPDAIPDGTEVVITEKIHGTNCRMGYVDTGDKFSLVAGSHKIRRKEEGLYWHFLDDKMKGLLFLLWGNGAAFEDILAGSRGAYNVVVFGEIFGPGVQDMQYGQKEKSLRVFDICVEGRYIGHDDVVKACNHFGIETVPELYRGPFSKEVVEQHTYGDSTFPVDGKFKGREGVVIKPLVEQHSDVLGGRMILKSVSADYLSRKGGKDLE